MSAYQPSDEEIEAAADVLNESAFHIPDHVAKRALVAAHAVAPPSEREQELKAAILDIDAHASPLAEHNGFVTGGYLVTIGALHRALGKIGHTAPLCDAEEQRDEALALLREMVSTTSWIEMSALFDRARAVLSRDTSTGDES